MLCLTRYDQEKVFLDAYDQNGRPIRIVVQACEIRGGRVKLGIHAPECVQISRPDSKQHRPKPEGGLLP
jgi:sRNA-binding carbon storage regulator CsrA